jgi:hypothetical protein
MFARLPFLVFVLAALSLRLEPRPALEPLVLASPIHAGCVRILPTQCKLHVDPFTIQVSSGKRLAAFQLQANDHLLYDFRTDVSNPPLSGYSPSAVRRDFAAACGQTYTVNLLARDSGDSAYLNVGQAVGIACPAGSQEIFLPLVSR